MIHTQLDLPHREVKPRKRGLTMMIDPGLFTGLFEDAVDSIGEHVDLVKFGWGTGLITKDIKRKIDILRSAGIAFYFGGTLFERYAVEGMVAEWRELCRTMGATHVEVSNGTVAMDNTEKARWVARLADEFVVISEVGFKDSGRSEALASAQWISYIQEDLAAGAHLVTAEARESGRSGICRPDGRPRDDLIEEILDSGVPTDRLLFEAPNKELQTYFIRRLGPSVNLGNIRADDVIALETLRLGLRSDTLPTGM
ncbi:phosphosulfolactate synthase [Pseudonocardia acidicola]|uniref:Phosphosulfolactate synthase n=1 Tax=Pseudonocardia acidicola TaxID=2724939 RepID=A0ABX1S8P4_9PSEU|nr:phosphosulfolactate synthase [Pseudonocardia acidicola]